MYFIFNTSKSIRGYKEKVKDVTGIVMIKCIDKNKQSSHETPTNLIRIFEYIVDNNVNTYAEG